MTCPRHGGNDGSIVCRWCDRDLIDTMKDLATKPLCDNCREAGACHSPEACPCHSEGRENG